MSDKILNYRCFGLPIFIFVCFFLFFPIRAWTFIDAGGAISQWQITENNVGYVNSQNCPYKSGCLGYCLCTIKDPESDVIKPNLKLYNTRENLLLWDRSKLLGGSLSVEKYFLSVDIENADIAKKCVIRVESTLGGTAQSNLGPDDNLAVCTFTEQEKDRCCCLEMSRSESAIIRDCKITTGSLQTFEATCNASLFSKQQSDAGGAMQIPGRSSSDIQGPAGTIILKELMNGDCEYWESESIPGSAEPKKKSEDTTAALKALAAAKLNPMNLNPDLNVFIGKATAFWVAAMGSLLLIFYIWAGFLWMTASGNPEKMNTAKKIFVWATLGVVVVLSSYMLVKFLFEDVLLLT